MNRTMDYGHHPDPAVRREIAVVLAGRPFWPQVWALITLKRLVVQVVLPTLAAPLIVGVFLFVRAHVPVTISSPADHGTTISHTPGGQ